MILDRHRPAAKCYGPSLLGLILCIFPLFEAKYRPTINTVGGPWRQHAQPFNKLAGFDNVTSSFTCQSRSGAIDLQASSNRCHFRKLCLESSSNEWQLYLGKELRPLFFDSKGKAHFDWPSEFLNIGHGLITPYVTWKPTVKWDIVPSDFAWAETEVAAYVSFNSYADHFGHALYDNLLPLANLLELFHLWNSGFQTILGPTQMVQAKPSYAYNTTNVLLNHSDPSVRLLQLISKNPAYSPDQIIQQHPQASGVCFRHVLAGTDGLQAAGQHMLGWNFRQTVMAHLDIEPLTSFVPTILVVHKEGRRRIENDKEIFEALRRQFKAGAAVEYHDAAHIGNETLKMKVQRMAKTSVLITPPGGLAQQAIFLPAGATAIMPNVLLDDLSSAPLDAPDYAHLEYVHIERLPVTQQDYARTTDRPQCENTGAPGVHSRLHNCNVRLEDLNPLMEMVKQALDAWRTDHRL